MAYIINFTESNKADFVFDISATDPDTGDAIDFTDVEVSIEIGPENCSPIISATIGDGITQPTSTVLEFRKTAEQMAVLQPGSYRIGGVYTFNDETNQLFVGSLVVYDGIAST